MCVCVCVFHFFLPAREKNTTLDYLAGVYSPWLRIIWLGGSPSLISIRFRKNLRGLCVMQRMMPLTTAWLLEQSSSLTPTELTPGVHNLMVLQTKSTCKVTSLREFFQVLLSEGTSSLSLSRVWVFRAYITAWPYPVPVSPGIPVGSLHGVSRTLLVTQQERSAFTTLAQGEVIVTQSGFGVHGKEAPREKEGSSLPQRMQENTWRGLWFPCTSHSPKPVVRHLWVFLEWDGMFGKLNQVG